MTTGMYRGRKVFENPLENALARGDGQAQPAAKSAQKKTKAVKAAKKKNKQSA
jgi:hypothetical protein